MMECTSLLVPDLEETQETSNPSGFLPELMMGNGVWVGVKMIREFEMADIFTQKTYKTELYVLISILFNQGAAIIQQPEAMLTTFLVREGLESTWRL